MSQQQVPQPRQSLGSKQRLYLLIAIFLITIGNTCEILNSQGILPNTWVVLLLEHWVIVIFSILFISSGILIWIWKCQGIVKDPISSLLWWRFLLIIIAVALFAIGMTIFVFKILDNVQSPWIIIMPIVLNALGLILMLFQWVFPIPQSEPLPQISSPSLNLGSDPVAETLLATESTLGNTNYRNILGHPPPTYPGIILERRQNGEPIHESIHRKLLSDDVTALVLTGITQIGKSTLAAQVYLLEEKRDPTGPSIFTDRPLWITVDSTVSMADLSGTLFTAFDENLIKFEDLSESNQALELVNLLKRPDKKRLVILDQLDKLLDERELKILKPGISEWLDAINSEKCASRVLITSSLWPKGTQEYPRVYMQEYNVKNLETMPYRILCNGVKREYVRTSPDQAPGFSALYRYTKFGMASLETNITLLQNQGGISADQQLLEVCVNRCGSHAGMLKRIASLLRNNPSLNLTDLLNNQEYSYHWRNIAYTIIKDTFDRLDNLQRDLLLAFSIFPTPIPLNEACTVIIDPNISKTQIRMAIDSLLAQQILTAVGNDYYQPPAIVTLVVE